MPVIKVYLSGRFIYRTLYEDSQGLYIKRKNQRVSVRLDLHSKLYYTAVKSSKPLNELKHEYKELVDRASDRSITTLSELQEIRQQLTTLRRAIKIASII